MKRETNRTQKTWNSGYVEMSTDGLRGCLCCVVSSCKQCGEESTTSPQQAWFVGNVVCSRQLCMFDRVSVNGCQLGFSQCCFVMYRHVWLGFVDKSENK